MTDANLEPDGAIKFKVGVYRVQVDEKISDYDLRKDRHKKRGAAITAEFEDASNVQVLEWGDTDSEEPHELVELIAMVTSADVQAAALSVVGWIGIQLADHAVDSAISAGMKTLARKAFRMQKKEKLVSDVVIGRVDAGSHERVPPELTVFPPEWDGRTVAQIWFEDGSRVEFHPPPGGWTGDPELEPAAHRISSATGPQSAD